VQNKKRREDERKMKKVRRLEQQTTLQFTAKTTNRIMFLECEINNNDSPPLDTTTKAAQNFTTRATNTIEKGI
jgi:hypothetical protein